MRLVVSPEQFLIAYGLSDRDSYNRFHIKLNREFERVVHPTVSVLSFEKMSRSQDAFGNIHVVWLGKVTAWEQKAEFGGEFVWLQGSATFRGKLWSRLENFTDEQLLILARNEFRLGRLLGAKSYLDSIQNIQELPHSAFLLKTKIDNEMLDSFSS